MKDTASNQQPKKANLFQIEAEEEQLLDEIQAIFDAASNHLNITGETPDNDPAADAQKLVDAHLDKLADVQDQLQAKLEGYVKAITAMNASATIFLAEADMYAAEVARLKKRAHRCTSDADFLQARLQAFMERKGITKLEVGTRTLSIVNVGGKQAVILNETVNKELVPKEYLREIPATEASWEWDKNKIAEAAKSGPVKITIEVEGEPQEIELAHLAERPKKLTIK